MANMNKFSSRILTSLALFLFLLLLRNADAQQPTYIFPCSVPNCQVCTYTNFCGLCNEGYLLTVPLGSGQPTCQTVECIIPNCNYCLTPNQCEQCNNGFQVTASGRCQQTNQDAPVCFQGCIACNAAGICLRCAYGYSLQQNNTCQSIISVLPYSCLVGAFPNICQICQLQMAVNPAYGCSSYVNGTCTVPNCYYCLSNNSCSVCNQGYTIQISTSTCVLQTCNISYCLTCSTSTTCSSCQQGFTLTNNNQTCSYQTPGCFIQGCIACNSAQICTSCAQGLFLYSTYIGYQVTQCLTPQQMINLNLPYVSVPSNCKTYSQYLPYFIQGACNGEYCIFCQTCNPGYFMIGGQCVIQINQTQFQCNVQNCKTCIFHNFCGLCNQGFVIIPNSGGLCVKMYSPVQNCLIISNYFNFPYQTCSLCQVSFILLSSQYNGQQYCFPMNQMAECFIQNCSYCITPQVCAECMSGYTFVTVSGVTTCQPNCTIQNCVRCQTQTFCQYCAQNYTVNYSTGGCVPQYSTNCTSIDPNCIQCISPNEQYCIACATGYSPCGSSCVANVQNMAGCLAYGSGGCGNAYCMQCQIGYILVSGVCYTIPCTSIPNCQFCLRSSKCFLCMQGFILNPTTGTCTSNSQYLNCSTQFNPFCTQCTSTNCTACQSGYILNNGQCSCNITNCMKCIGNMLCYECAFPLIPNFIQGGGCIPTPNANQACQVSNCAMCTSPTKCSICNAGYVVNASNQCTRTQCSSNCQLCDPLSLICYLCNPGYTQDQFLGQNCVAVPANYTCLVDACSVCSLTNPNVCTHCLEFYTLNNGACQLIKCITDCMVCLQPNTCIVCASGYYLNTSLACQYYNSNQPQPQPQPAPTPVQTCLSTIPNCLICNYNQYFNGSTVTACNVCMVGYQPSQNSLSCIPQDCSVPNCQICIPEYNIPFCLLCDQGYFINSYFQCVPYSPQPLMPSCNVYNCLYCAYNNSCTFCAPGYLPINGVCTTSTACADPNCIQCTQPSICLKCQTGYIINNSSGLCAINCNIANCVTCLNSNACQTCSQNYTATASGLQCNCKQGFQIINNICQCPSLSSYNSTAQTCTACNVSNCLYCTISNVCAQCANSFVSNGSGCSCPDNSFAIVSGVCTCPNTTTYNGSSCISCQIANCLVCNSNNLCFQCNTNFLNVNNNSCSCPSPYTLQNQNLCQCAVNTTYFQNQCIACPILNCLQCQQPNVCSQCSTGYLFNNATAQLCVQCGIANCLYCSSVNYCTQCVSGSGLVVNSQGNQCITCNVANCALCSSANICYTCSPGYQFASNNTSPSCVQCSSIAGCYSCSSNNVCAVCLPGYSLNSTSNQCITCQYPCATCQPGSSNCLTCQFPYSSIAAGYGGCYTCQVANCMTCPPGNVPNCTTCVIGYIYNQTTNTCNSPCPQYCDSCSTTGICLACQPGFMLQSSMCVKCSGAPMCSYCNITNTSLCLQCASGYYLTAQSNCQACPSNCDTCTPSGCLTFKPSTNQIAVVINGNTLPAVCDPGCKQCSGQNPNQCISCAAGLYLSSNNVCMPCTGQCKTCAVGSPSTCYSCFSNSYLVNGQCLQCAASSNCLTCSATNTAQCVTCPYGYLLASSGVCQAVCPLNCLTCTNTTFCTLCQQGYSPNVQGICLPCTSNCRYCSTQANAICLSCGQGFYLNTATSTCMACSSYCLSCTSLGCNTCMLGYTLNSLFQCTPICSIPCATCSATNPSQCTSCLAGYQFNQVSNTCSAITTCTNGCSICPFGYVLNNNQCTQCSTANCVRCSASSPSTCTSCSQGYYLSTSTSTSNSQCIKCPPKCSTCSSPNNCLTCSSGYATAAQSVSSDQVQCIQCISPCATCIANANTCSSCVAGYALQGWKCVTSFNFGFAVTFNQNLNTFYNNYYQFLQAITNAVQGTNINAVTIGKIAQQSIPTSSSLSISHLQLLQVSQTNNVVTVQGSADITSPSGSNTATTQYNQLNSLFSPGNTVAGMGVVNSSVSVNGGQLQPSYGNNNLAIILGVCIPVGIILIAVIAYVVYKKTRKDEEESSSQGETGRGVKEDFQLGSRK